MVNKSLILCFGLTLVANAQSSVAQTRSNEAKSEEAYREMLGLYKDKSRHDEFQDKELQRIKDRLDQKATDSLKNPKLAADAESLAQVIKDSKLPHQEQVFMRALAELACRTLDDGCELKARLHEYEARLRQLEREKSHPDEPTPVQPSPNTHAPPTWQKPIWTGSINAIVLKHELCPKAVMLAQCVDKDFGDVVYHGDVFLNCQGQYVFVKHNKTNPQPMLLAKPVTP